MQSYTISNICNHIPVTYGFKMKYGMILSFMSIDRSNLFSRNDFLFPLKTNPENRDSLYNFCYFLISHSKCTRSQSHNNLVIPMWNTNFGKKTFHYNRAAILWNMLPTNIPVNFNLLIVNQFKNAIPHNYIQSKCICLQMFMSNEIFCMLV